MEELLPSIGVQKAFNHTNFFHNYKKFSSVDSGKKDIFKNHNSLKYGNFTSKQEIINKNNYANNFLKITNINKDEINSIKNNTAITYYNKSYTNKKSTNNNNNIFPETFYNYYQNFKSTKKPTSSNFNNINVIQSHTQNLNLLLPDFHKEKTINRQKNPKKGYAHSFSNSFNKMLSKNNGYNIKNNPNNNINNKNNNLLNLVKLDSQKIIQNPNNDTLTAVDYFSNKSYFPIYKNKKSNDNNRGFSLDNKYLKPFKSNNLFNSNMPKLKTCHICHKEIENYRYRFHLNLHPSKIFEWLYLGSYRNACDKQEIKDIGINYVLNCAIECMESFPSGVKYCHLKLNDMPSFKIIPYLEKATSFIHQAHINNGIILVHCQLGISRSTSCVIAYFIKYMGYTAMNALDFIKKKRPQVMPNFGFLQQLMNYERNNIGTGKKNDMDDDNKNLN